MRLDERSARRLACADGARDLGKDEGRVRDRGQADQVNRSLERGRCRRLQGEPALAGSTRAGDRHEPHVGAAEQRLDRRQVVLTADESMMQRRQCRTAERPGRRERLSQAVCDELVEALLLRDVLEAVPSQIDGLVAGVGKEVARELRHEDLPAMGDGLDPRGADDVDPDIALRAALGLARVQAHADEHVALVRPFRGGEGSLPVDGRRGGIRCATERDHERVPLRVDLDAAVPRERFPEQLSVLVLDGGIACPECAEETRRALDVGEEQRDRAVGQVRSRIGRSHGSSLGAAVRSSMRRPSASTTWPGRPVGPVVRLSRRRCPGHHDVAHPLVVRARDDLELDLERELVRLLRIAGRSGLSRDRLRARLLVRGPLC